MGWVARHPHLTMNGTAIGTVEMTAPDMVNMRVAGPDAIRRRGNRDYMKTADPVAQEVFALQGTDSGAFSIGQNEPVFTMRKRGRNVEREDGRQQVLPTFNGFLPETVFEHLVFAGIAHKQTNYMPDVPIAIKQSGKAKLLNTGSAAIHSGEWVELYAMDTMEAKRFKRTFNTGRVMAGLRMAEPKRSALRDALKAFRARPDTKAGGFAPKTADDKLLHTIVSETTIESRLDAIDEYRAQHQSRVIGRALGTAAPGNYFELLISPIAPN